MFTMISAKFREDEDVDEDNDEDEDDFLLQFASKQQNTPLNRKFEFQRITNRRLLVGFYFIKTLVK